MTVVTTPPRAFAVWWKDLHVWSPRSFADSGWLWPQEHLKPLSSVLRRRKVEIHRDGGGTDGLQLITIRFSGEVEPRKMRGNARFKGRLYEAQPGDVVYSKIDVRNGAIGIVPEGFSSVAVSSEYPVYEVQSAIADPEYIKLLFRTDRFRETINSMVSGASGRKRVEPRLLQAVEIPLPPLPVQRAIVDRWRAAREEVAAARGQGEAREMEIPRVVLGQLGIQAQDTGSLRKVFAIPWRELDRWSVAYLTRTQAEKSSLRGCVYPLAGLGAIAEISYGITKSPANRPGANARPYLRVANVQRGQLDLTHLKYIDVTAAELENLRLQRGDLLVCEGNSADLVGRPAMWEEQIADCIHQNHILRVRVNMEQAIPEYVLEYMQTEPARNHFRARAKFTTNLASINSRDLRELQIPLPPLDVQRALVERVREMRAEVAPEREAAERRERESREEIEALIRGTKSISA